MTRQILFAEVPSFYATVEIAEHPDLAGRPVVVGGNPRKRGLVQSASAEALAAGVEPEMLVAEALRLCPQARALRTDMPLYREVSRRLLACLRRVAGRLEPFGLGAAYIDAGAAALAPEALAERLREEVRETLSLPLRVGIASGKFLARLAAEESGQAGVRVVPAGGEAAFLHPLPVARLEGVGSKTAAALAELGAHTIGAVAALGRARLEAAFGSHGLRIHALASARDDAPVRAALHPQTLSREVTVAGETRDRAVLAEHLAGLARQLEDELARQGLAAGRVGVKVRFADQVRTTRSLALATPTAAAREIQAVAGGLLDRTQVGSRAVRVLGIQLGRLSAATEAGRQLDLFAPRS